MRLPRGRRATLTLVALAVLASLSAMPSSAVAERTIGISQGVVDFTLAPGQSASDSINVANNGDESLKVLLYTADIIVDAEGNVEYKRPDPNDPTSPASWVRLKTRDDTKVYANTPYLEMDPGDELTIDYSLVVPPGTPSGDHNAILFFEMFDFAEEAEQTGSLVSGRLGSRLAIRAVGEITDQLDLTSLAARGFVVGTQMPFGVRVDNSGSNVDKTFSLSLRLVGSGENEVWSEELEADGRVYARNERDYSGVGDLNGVGAGRYTLHAVLDSTLESGVDSITVEPLQLDIERTVWVVPLWLAIALVLLIALPLLYASWRLSRRQPRRRDRRDTRYLPPEATYHGRERPRGRRDRRRADYYDPSPERTRSRRADDEDDFTPQRNQSRDGDAPPQRASGTISHEDDWADGALDD